MEYCFGYFPFDTLNGQSKTMQHLSETKNIPNLLIEVL